MGNIRKHLWISGKVQGVFFRQSTIYRAKIQSLTGWVKNLDDGRVEIVVEGPEDRVEKLIEWCKKGPIAAEIQNINIRDEEYTGNFEEFKLAY